MLRPTERTFWRGEQPTLSDGVVRIRGWRGADAGWVHAACQDSEIQRWTRVSNPYQLRDAEGFIKIAEASWTHQLGVFFAVCDARSGSGLGSIGLRVIDASSGVADIGYWTCPEARGAGVTTRAVNLISEWGLREVGLERIELLAETGNVASRQVARRGGYQYEGVMRNKLRRAGENRNVALYARIG